MGAVALFSGPVGWVLAAAGLGLAYLAAYYKDKPFPDWIKHGPIGIEPFTGQYIAWMHAPEPCLHALMGILLPPKLTIAQENDELECKFALVVTLDTPLYVDSKDEKDTHRIITSFARVGNSDPTLAVMGITGAKTVVEPYRREFVKSPDGVFVKKSNIIMSRVMTVSVLVSWGLGKAERKLPPAD